MSRAMRWRGWLPRIGPGGKGAGRVRPAVGPAVAGTWYAADADVLARDVDGYLAGGDLQTNRAAALIGPHAGFRYSGAVAGRGFARVRGLEYDRVVLVGPSHFVAFQGAALPDADVYRTPLGDVELDRAALGDLASLPQFMRSSRPFGPEHSLEAELPFLQRALDPGWRLVPVLLGPGSTGELAQKIADGLRPLAGDRTLWVVSSDFTHFGPRFAYVPFRTEIPEKIRDLDMGAIRLVESGDAAGFGDYVRRTGATICGRDAIDVLLRTLPETTRGRLVAYDTSGRITGDWDHSVSYAALVFGQG